MVTIEAVRQPMFNVAVAGSVVMHHRLLQRRSKTDAQTRRETAGTVGVTAAADEAVEDPDIAKCGSGST